MTAPSPRRSWLILSIAAFIAGFSGCRSSSETSGQEAPPAELPKESRLVSLSPALTGTLNKIGAGPSLVGVSDYCNGAEAPKMGSALTPKFEAIAQARPTTILTTQVVGNLIPELGRLAPTVELPWLTLDDALRGTLKLGEITGHSNEAKALHQKMSASLAKVAPPNAPAILLVIAGADPTPAAIWYVKPNSLHGSLLGALGYNNAIDHPVTGSPQLSVEALLTLNPDGIVLLRPAAPNSQEEERLLSSYKKLSPLQAVRANRLAIHSHPDALTMGPELLDQLPPLGRLLDALFADQAAPVQGQAAPAQDPVQ